MKRIANNRHAMLKRVLPILIKIATPQSVAEANAVRQAKLLQRYLAKS
ncbi:MAG: hypothetical protein J6U69_02570 [Alistipes sp.]|nr:hypothetical protein [Alistipes sp.]